MFVEAINKLTASHKSTRRHHLLSFFFALVFALTIYPTQAHAQIIGDLEAKIPFQFHVGDTKLPGRRVPHSRAGRCGSERHGNHQRGRLYFRGLPSTEYRCQPRIRQHRIDLQQIRESLLSCEVV